MAFSDGVAATSATRMTGAEEGRSCNSLELPASHDPRTLEARSSPESQGPRVTGPRTDCGSDDSPRNSRPELVDSSLIIPSAREFIEV